MQWAYGSRGMIAQASARKTGVVRNERGLKMPEGTSRAWP